MNPMGRADAEEFTEGTRASPRWWLAPLDAGMETRRAAGARSNFKDITEPRAA